MLPPIRYHIFSVPLPYIPTLALQNQLQSIALEARRSGGSNDDILLLLQHRPVYTAGRREVEGKEAEMARLQGLGADWVKSDRGGLTTYHGPGQLVGYPLLDLGRMDLSVRCYVDRIEQSLRKYLHSAHGVHAMEVSPQPGLFLSPTAKIASLGVAVRHRLTTHGFALNVTQEPIPWFAQIVACGLEGVKAACIQDELALQRGQAQEEMLTVEKVARGLTGVLGEVFERDVQPLEELPEEVKELERMASEMGWWNTRPKGGDTPIV